MPKTEMFAANHGQNRSRGNAVRPDSAMISIPARSRPRLRALSNAEDGDVRGEPWPEQVPRDRRPLRLGDDLDPGPLQAETAGLFVCGGRGLWRRCRDARGHGTRVPDNLGRPAHLRIVAGTRLTPD